MIMNAYLPMIIPVVRARLVKINVLDGSYAVIIDDTIENLKEFLEQ